MEAIHGSHFGIYTCEVDRGAGIAGSLIEVWHPYRQSSQMGFLIRHLGRVRSYGDGGDLWSFLPPQMMPASFFDPPKSMLDQVQPHDQDESGIDLESIGLLDLR